MDIIAQFLKESGCKEWEHPRTHTIRIYLGWHAKDFLEVKTDWYKTGNLRDFRWIEGHESNCEGRRILAALEKAYYDTDKEEFVTTNDRVTEALTDACTKAAENWKNTYTTMD